MYENPDQPSKPRSRPAYEVIDSVKPPNTKKKEQQEDTYARLDKARMEIHSSVSGMPDGLYASLGRK